MTTRGRKAWWVVATAAVAGLLLSVVVTIRAGDSEVREVVGDGSVSSAATSPGPGPSAGSGPDTGTGRRPRDVVRADDASLEAATTQQPRPPSRLRVPRLGLDFAVTPVGVTQDRQMELPDDPRVLGWYRFGTAPGGRGSVVLAGHVDSRTYGVGPLVALQSISAGVRVEVVTGANRVQAYRVDSIERFDQGALPAALFARTGPERLRLVTCTGPYLPESGGYQQNLVVSAVPVRG
jgi:sortase (surface protein transpeptidase)